MASNKPYFAIVLLSLVVVLAFSNPLDDAIYTKWKTPIPCTRWLSSHGQIGCTSHSEGASGILWPVLNETSLQQFLKAHPKHSNLIVVLSDHLLTPSTVLSFEKIKQIKGLAVIKDNNLPLRYSETSHFPQSDVTTLGEPSSYQWNIPNHDLIHHEYKWPMWYVTDLEARKLTEMSLSNVKSNSRHAARMKQFMFGYKDTKTCLHHKFCEPVGGHSVWGVLPAPKRNPSSRSYNLRNSQFVMTLSSMDSISIFPGIAVGADTDMSGLIANLAALTTLAGLNNLHGANPPDYVAVNPSNFKYPIMYSFFEAEHWGYAGSSRFLNDWKNFTCLDWADSSHTACNYPYYPTTDFTQLSIDDNIRAMVELKQVGALDQNDNNPKLFVHQHQHHYDTDLVLKVIDSALDLETNVAHAASTNPGLPPSSSFSFLKKGGNSLSEKTVVIADHDSHYNNKYYGSRFDDQKNINEKMITDSATILARTLYAYAMDTSAIEASFIKVNQTIVQDLVECLVVNSNCKLFASFLPDIDTFKLATPSHYPGPYFDNALSQISKFTHDYMIYVSRNRSLDSKLPTCKSDPDCKSNAGPLTRCVVGKCINSAYVQYHDSYSVGIERTSKGWSVVDESLPNWAEPYWDNTSFETFTMGNPVKEGFFLFWAIVQTILAFVGIHYFKKVVSPKWETMK